MIPNMIELLLIILIILNENDENLHNGTRHNDTQKKVALGLT